MGERYSIRDAMARPGQGPPPSDRCHTPLPRLFWASNSEPVSPSRGLARLALVDLLRRPGGPDGPVPCNHRHGSTSPAPLTGDSPCHSNNERDGRAPVAGVNLSGFREHAPGVERGGLLLEVRPVSLWRHRWVS